MPENNKFCGRKYSGISEPVTRKGTLGRNLTHQVGQSTRVFFDKPLNAFMGAGELGARISDFDGDIGLTGAEDGLLRVGMIVSSPGAGDRPASARCWHGPGVSIRDHAARVPPGAARG